MGRPLNSRPRAKRHQIVREMARLDTYGEERILAEVREGRTFKALRQELEISDAAWRRWKEDSEGRPARLQEALAERRSRASFRTAAVRRQEAREAVAGTQAEVLVERGEGHVFSRISNGESIRSICDDLGVDRRAFHRWLDLLPGRRERYVEVIRVSAGAHADKAGAVLDEALENPLLSSAHAQIYKAKSGYHRYRAGIADPETYREQAKVNVGVGVSIGELHLDALRKFGSVRAEGDNRVEEAEFDVLEGDE